MVPIFSFRLKKKTKPIAISTERCSRIITRLIWHNERNAFHHLFDEHSFAPDSVFIFDRGYEGYPLMAHIASKGQFFLIRAKD